VLDESRGIMSESLFVARSRAYGSVGCDEVVSRS
jgi:hypothetical protein